MKKLLLFIFPGMVLWSSCGLLEQNSPNDLNAETAIQDAASARAALLGVYASMQQSAYYGGTFPLMTEPLAGNAATGGFQVLSLDELGTQAPTPSNLIVEESWIAIYRTIANANALLEALPGIADFEPGEAAQVEGAAKALRAMAHFDLLRTFGEHWDNTSRYGIPVISQTQSIDDRPSRAGVEASYSFIINELNSTLELLEDAPKTPQFVHTATIKGLLARVYLYQKKYSEAAGMATALIEDGGYQLFDVSEYPLVFSERRTPESVFELAFDRQNRSDFNSLTYSRPDALRPELFFMAAADLNHFFAGRADDVRAALLDFSAENNDATILPDGRSQKYRGEEARDNPAYLLRLAEMYLIRAEAQGYPSGLEDLNTLREKRGLSALSTTDIADESAFLDAVLDERRAEFNFEGHYYYDLARTGQYEARTGQPAYRAILPVPYREIIASGGKIEQNQGY